jgi:PAS domain S-box-containing protein
MPLGGSRVLKAEQHSCSTTRPDDADLLRLIIDSATDFAVFATDQAGLVISWNTGAERLTGFSEAEMLGQSGDQIFTPEDRARGAPERERDVARERGRSEDERWHRRKDGSRFWGSGLMMPLRNQIGFVKIMRDRTGPHEHERELRESQNRFRMLATSIPQLVFRSFASGKRTWGSPQWEIYAGLSDLQSRGFGWLEAIHPDDRTSTEEAWQHAQRTGEYYVEHRIRRHADGQHRWHQTRAKPVGDTLSSEWVGTSADIHELRGLQERQQVLLAELQHRTRNLLALVQAIARQTIKTSDSLASFSTEFSGRLAALSRVQGMLASGDHGPVELRGILKAELEAHGADDRVTIEGDPASLQPNEAQALALALHELATNAVKYGALGQPNAQLAITWRIQKRQTRHRQSRRLVLDWRESGVAMQETAQRKGYGRELIERALPYQLNASTKFEIETDGVHCTIELPVE